MKGEIDLPALIVEVKIMSTTIVLDLIIAKKAKIAYKARRGVLNGIRLFRL